MHPILVFSITNTKFCYWSRETIASVRKHNLGRSITIVATDWSNTVCKHYFHSCIKLHLISLSSQDAYPAVTKPKRFVINCSRCLEVNCEIKVGSVALSLPHRSRLRVIFYVSTKYYEGSCCNCVQLSIDMFYTAICSMIFERS